MSTLERQVGKARLRLILNELLQYAALGVAVAAALWAVVLIVGRLTPADVPLWPSLSGAAALAVTVAIGGLLIRPVRPLTAAIALDRAAGLKERVSTGFVCSNGGSGKAGKFTQAAAVDNDFARAAVMDAEKAAGGLSVRTHVPLRAPRTWPWSAGFVLLAAGLAAFLPEKNLFAREKAASPEEQQAVERERQAIKTAMSEQVDRVKRLAESNPELKDAVKDLASLDLPKAPNVTPEDIRREAVKQIDKLADKLAEQRNAEKEDTLKQLKRMMAQLEAKQDNSPTDKLAQSLSSGDFSGAKQALEEMKKQLEDAAKTGDPEARKKLAEMQQKLDSVAQQLQQSANAQQLAKELEAKAGMSPEQAKEMLKQLSKMDPKQLEKELQKRLAEKGMTQEQIQKLAQKMANNQKAMQQAQKMADALQKASKCMGQQGQQGKQGQQGQQSESQQGDQAAQALAEAAEQLSELEMADQQLDELQARLAELDELKDDIGEGNCQGNQPGDKIGQQGGNEGLGRGSRIGKDKQAHQFKFEKAKSKLKGGHIIGQMLVEGEQVKGEAQAAVQDAVNAAQRDATEAINRDEVPAQYERALKTYFDRLAGLSGGAAPPQPEPQAGTSEEKDE